MQLYLTTYGTFLHIKKGMFEVRIPGDDGPEKKKVPPQKVTTIVMDRGTSLTWEVVKTALQHNIDIVFTEGDGAPIGRVWHSKLGSTTRIRKRQLEASLNAESVEWIKQWIVQKIENQVDLLKTLKKHRKTKRPRIDETIEKLDGIINKVQRLEGETITDIDGTIRGLEGTAGRAYFKLLSELLVGKYQFQGRSSRPAEDAFNAFLNYAYGILYSRIERCVMIAGLDPYVGFLHRDDYNKTSFVFDFIEPYRPYADYAVFKLFSGKRVNQDHTREIKNGVGLTKPGKKMIVKAFVQHFDEETIRYRGKNQTRINAIQQDAHTVANKLIES